ncbi:MAG TPA: MarR family transcriptional regulator [Bryobacteraceae bacterium]|nr:MarR family transcriptional regulator [Bryobacteraceae bacterium]
MNDVTAEKSAAIETQLRQLIGYFDTLSQRLMVKRSPGLVPDVEVSQQEIRAVLKLGRKESTIMSDLAGELNLPLSTATHTMDKLVAKGLAERARVNENRRTVRVALTEKGRKLHQCFLDFQLAMGRSMLESLSPGERELFLELMVKMTQPARGSVEANEAGRHS